MWKLPVLLTLINVPSQETEKFSVLEGLEHPWNPYYTDTRLELGIYTEDSSSA